MNNIEPIIQSCIILAGIGSQFQQKLEHLNIFSIFDLIIHLPYRYQDRTRVTMIRDLRLHQPAVVQGTVIESHWLKGKRRVYHCSLRDASGTIALRFFHMPPFLEKRLQNHTQLKAFGEVKLKAHGLEMIHPEIEILNDLNECNVQEFFTPWYPSTQGLHQNQWRKWMLQIFELFKHHIAQMEWLPTTFLQQHQLMPIEKALHILHFPTPDCSCEDLLNPQHPARRRLALEELVAYSLSSMRLKSHQKKEQGYAYHIHPILKNNLIAQLPFQLTESQLQVLEEIEQDLQQPHPMLRLLQGDVGSGKTIVCVLAALPIFAQGHQVAMMAPTDLLSAQHFQNIQPWLNALGFKVARLSRTTPAKEKKQILQDLKNGDCHFIIGTHALFQDKVVFHTLGLVIIDEQHRFGVMQRLKLTEKAHPDFQPHQLFVTATPIPRTLAMTQFAHFDVSILKHRPEGRKPIQTAVMPEDKRDSIIERLKVIVQQGGQIYWVCTRIEQDEEMEQQAVEDILSYLNESLPKARIGMVHGKLKANEKESIMAGFKQHEYDILVATTVIEVGVDVPNANIIIIENAEMFGLAQLHQLRGRVGRGQQEAYCILMYNAPLSENGHKRLQSIRQSFDGFWLAEQDLLIRGAGDVFGTAQTGFKDFKIAQIPDHMELFTLAHQLAKNHLDSDRIIQRWYHDSQKFLQA